MNIGLIHPNEIAEYHLERIVHECLVDMGHNVKTFKYRGCDHSDIRPRMQALNPLDLAIVLKGELLVPEDVAALDCPVAVWYVDVPKPYDDPVLPEWLAPLVSACDGAFFSCFPLVDKARRLCPNSHWVVEGAHLPLLRPHGHADKRYELSFVGTTLYEKRREFLMELQEKYDMHVWGIPNNMLHVYQSIKNIHGPVWNDALAQVIAESKVVLGYNGSNSLPLYWSNRVYVTLACRGFMVTPYVPRMEEVWENHKELVWFHGTEEFHDLMDYYLKNDAQRERIAEAGYAKVRGIFQSRQQVERLLDKMRPEVISDSSRKSVLFITHSGYVGCQAATRNWGAMLAENGVRCSHQLVSEESPATQEMMCGHDVVVTSGSSGAYSGVLGSPPPGWEGRRFAAWFSSALQTQVEEEMKAVRAIKSHESNGALDGVLCTDPSMARVFGNGVHVPAFLVEATVAPDAKKMTSDDRVNVCVLGPAKARKNVLTALMSLLYSPPGRYRFHLNLPPEDYDLMVDGIVSEDDVENHGWLDRGAYLDLISQCDIGLHLSVGESYDYVCAEHLALGTPVICSTSVTSVPSKDLHLSEFENAGLLVQKMEEVLRVKKERLEAWKSEFERDNQRRYRKALITFKKHVVPDQEFSCKARVGLSRRPLLSVVFHGRNDDYANGFKRRLAYAILSAKRAFSKLSPEIIFVDWNEPEKAPFLFDDPELLGCGDGVITYVVSSSVHDKICMRHGCDRPYLEWYARNVGIRRATGEFILSVNADGFYPYNMTAEDLPDARTTLLADRWEVNPDILGLPVDEARQELMEYDAMIEGSLKLDLARPSIVGGPCGEFILSHRDNWHETRGFVETEDRYAMDNILAAHFREITDLDTFRYPVYHVSHKSAGGAWPRLDYGFGCNGPDWGLADVDIRPRRWP